MFTELMLHSCLIIALIIGAGFTTEFVVKHFFQNRR